MAAEFSFILLCSEAVITLASLGLAFLLVSGAVNSRAEEDYWDRFWRETPLACIGSEASEDDEIIEFRTELRLAA